LDTSELDNEIGRLQAEKAQLTRTIELALESVKSLELSALSAERLNRGHLSDEREAWIRATVRSRDQVFLDSLFLDLERVTNKICSLAGPSDNDL
jgi:hypothetical protein